MTSSRIDPPDEVLEGWLRDLGGHLDLGPGDTPEGRSALVAAVLDGIDDTPGIDDTAAPKGVMDTAAPKGVMDTVAPKGVMDTVAPKGVMDTVAPKGVMDTVAPKGVMDTVAPKGVMDTVAPKGVMDTAAPKGVVHRRGFRSYRVPTAAAIVVVALAVLLAVAPAREAIADWFGIGSVLITRSDAPPSTNDLPGRSTTPPSPTDPDDLDDDLPFEPRLPDPDRYGKPVAVLVDPAVPSGLVELRYDGFSLVEVASQPDELPVLSKQLGPGTSLTGVTVRGVDGFWLSGDVHEVLSIRPDGEVATDTLRRAGDVLVWEEDGVTYRIEGLDTLEAALDVASSID